MHDGGAHMLLHSVERAEGGGERETSSGPTDRANAICKPVVDDDVSSSIILGVVNIANSRRERERWEREGKESWSAKSD